MLTQGVASRSDRRLLGCYLASVLLNLVAWSLAIWVGNPIRHVVPDEVLAIRTTRIRLEHAPPSTPAPVSTPEPRHIRPHPRAIALGPATPPTRPTLSLPKNWQTTYMGSAGVNDRDVRLWLDWSHQSAEFVPRIYLWHRTIDALDPREVTLRDAVNTVVAQLTNEGSVTFYANRPERVCGGRYPGWFLSYDKRDGDPKIHVDDMLLIAHNTIYRATYVRTLDEGESQKTREALRSLC